MSKQTWKFGDAALVTCSDGKERIALYGTRWIDDSGVWLFPDKTMRDVDNSDARRLVVIDPESNDVERLQDLYVAAEAKGLSGLSMQAALRELANPAPPKPVWTDGDAVQVGTTGAVYIRGRSGWSDPASDGVVDRAISASEYRIIRRQSDGADA